MKTANLRYAALLTTMLWTMSPPANAGTHRYSYDGAGRLTAVDYGAGRRIEYIYDPAGNLLRRTALAFLDSDGDQMDDLWEQNHFGGLSRDGTADFDGDGQTDLREFLSGTLPKNPNSALRVIQLGEGITITWQAVPGKRYRLQYKDRLENSPWTELPGDIQATGLTASKLDTTAASVNSRYYRVQLIP